MDALFRFDWCANDKVVSAFSSLLSHLVSANSTCMVPAMHMLVRKLVLSPMDIDGKCSDGPRLTACSTSYVLQYKHPHAECHPCMILLGDKISTVFGTVPVLAVVGMLCSILLINTSGLKSVICEVWSMT